MNALIRFCALGAADADARVARALAPRRLEAADGYLRDSQAGQCLDRATLRLESWWRTSVFRHTATAIADGWRRERKASQYRALGLLLVIATATHVLLTLLQGPRPGWFWLVIPALVAALGAWLLAAARATDANR